MKSHRPVALVTGAARRLGRSIAEQLARDGFGVWVHYHTSESEAVTVQEAIRGSGGTAWRIQGDLSTDAGIATVAQAILDVTGRLDVLVNNVGIYEPKPCEEQTRGEFEQAFATNTLAPLELIRRLTPLLQADGGSVINVGYSGLPALSSSPDNLAYVLSKVGLLLITRTFAEVLGPLGIRVNMVSPGQLENSVDLPSGFEDRVPLGRAGTMGDVCDAVSFLVSSRAAYITGQNLEVAGGYMLGLKDDRESSS